MSYHIISYHIIYYII